MNKKQSIKFDKLSKGFLITSGIFIIFSFFAPKIFTQESFIGIDFSKTGSIGDTIGGIMNPFIALAGIFLTFLAFYIQLKANQQQRVLFRQELMEQNIQFRKNQLENQFYEMIKLHRENINDISLIIKHTSIISGAPFQKKDIHAFEEKIIGREVFKYFLNEIEILYYVAKEVYPDLCHDVLLQKAYHIFWVGIDVFSTMTTRDIELEKTKQYIEKLRNIRNENDQDGHAFTISMQRYGIKRYKYTLFCGYSSILAHYYRNLFQIVKFIVSQNNTGMDYPDKRKYLRILRAQLSNQEQVMLFYNWKSGFGTNWESKINHFFTDYRMIHNISNDIIIKDFDLIQIFRLNDEIYYKTEPNRNDDNLFEFQDEG
jgi:hypothetical protein